MFRIALNVCVVMAVIGLVLQGSNAGRAPASAQPEKRGGEPGSGVIDARVDVVLRALVTPQSLIIDAREPGAFLRRHVRGAANLAGAGDPVAGAGTGERMRSAPMIVVYGESADSVEARILAIALSRKAGRTINYYVAGWQEWSQFGLPSEGGG
jgi:3-mercaptopyruvate sulfurtransferase SseA